MGPTGRNRPKAAVLLLFGVEEEEEESMVHGFRALTTLL